MKAITESQLRDQSTIRLNARIVEVHDGDTVTVEIRVIEKIRMIGCWAKEVRGDEKADGIKAKEHLESIIRKAGTDHCVVETPLFPDIGKSTSMGRVLGTVTMTGDSVSLSQRMVEDGFATESK